MYSILTDPVQPGVPFLKRPPTNGPGGVGVGYPGADFISDVNQYALGLGGPGPGPNFPRPGGPSRPPVPPGVPLETGDINNKLTGQIAPTSDLEGPALHLLNGPVNFRVPDLKLPVHGNFYDGFKDGKFQVLLRIFVIDVRRTNYKFDSRCWTCEFLQLLSPPDTHKGLGRLLPDLCWKNDSKTISHVKVHHPEPLQE